MEIIQKMHEEAKMDFSQKPISNTLQEEDKEEEEQVINLDQAKDGQSIPRDTESADGNRSEATQSIQEDQSEATQSEGNAEADSSSNCDKLSLNSKISMSKVSKAEESVETEAIENQTGTLPSVFKYKEKTAYEEEKIETSATKSTQGVSFDEDYLLQVKEAVSKYLIDMKDDYMFYFTKAYSHLYGIKLSFPESMPEIDEKIINLVQNEEKLQRMITNPSKSIITNYVENFMKTLSNDLKPYEDVLSEYYENGREVSLTGNLPWMRFKDDYLSKDYFDQLGGVVDRLQEMNALKVILEGSYEERANMYMDKTVFQNQFMLVLSSYACANDLVIYKAYNLSYDNKCAMEEMQNYYDHISMFFESMPDEHDMFNDHIVFFADFARKSFQFAGLEVLHESLVYLLFQTFTGEELRLLECSNLSLDCKSTMNGYDALFSDIPDSEKRNLVLEQLVTEKVFSSFYFTAARMNYILYSSSEFEQQRNEVFKLMVNYMFVLREESLKLWKERWKRLNEHFASFQKCTYCQIYIQVFDKIVELFPDYDEMEDMICEKFFGSEEATSEDQSDTTQTENIANSEKNFEEDKSQKENTPSDSVSQSKHLSKSSHKPCSKSNKSSIGKFWSKKSSASSQPSLTETSNQSTVPTYSSELEKNMNESINRALGQHSFLLGTISKSCEESKNE